MAMPVATAAAGASFRSVVRVNVRFPGSGRIPGLTISSEAFQLESGDPLVAEQARDGGEGSGEGQQDPGPDQLEAAKVRLGQDQAGQEGGHDGHEGRPGALGRRHLDRLVDRGTHDQGRHLADPAALQDGVAVLVRPAGTG